MNDATLNIIIRVQGRQAIASMGAVAAATRGVSGAAASSTAKAGKGFSALSRRIDATSASLWKATKANLNFSNSINTSNLVKHGKNINWVGRQLSYTFTLPVLAAGAAIFKFQKDVEESMVQVRKVYGDLTFDQKRVKEETDLLSKSFELLSTRFGVHQKEVVDIGAAWASAGSAGRGLAENVKLTLQTMILGEMEATEATEALIAIQSVWKASTVGVNGEMSEMTDIIATLNIVENETAATMQDLIEVFERAGGSARTAGVTIGELAAMTASIVPATGQAEQAGAALKTIFSRLQAPTRQTTELLQELGFATDDPSWLGQSVTGKLKDLATQWEGMTSAQKSYSASVLGSRWQVNRLDVLLTDMAAGPLGYYQKALDAASDKTMRQKTLQKELSTVLESSPRRWEIMKTTIMNTMSSAFIPLMPLVVNLITQFARLTTWFSKLPAETRNFIALALVGIAVLGPMLMLLGNMMQLIGVFGAMGKMVLGFAGTFAVLGFQGIVAAKKLVAGFSFVAGKAGLVKVWTAVMGGMSKFGTIFVTKSAAIGTAASAALTGPYGWAIIAAIVAIGAAVAAVLTTDIEDPFIRVFRSIVNAMGQLPQAIADIFQSVINVLGTAMTHVVDLLSYLNPFQRHSPSLVDNVRAGVAVILDEYAKLSRIPAIVARAMASLGAFNVKSSSDSTSFRRTELADKVSQVSAVNPAAGASASVMADNIMELEAALPALNAEISKQEVAVARLTATYDKAVLVVDRAKSSLDAIQDAMQETSSKIQDAQGIINELANMPINGMIAMEDQIFANEQAQNQLNLRLLEMEKSGITIDGVRSKMEALNGEMEMLQGERSSLRLSGAGSDILSVYDDQIAALDEQRSGMSGVVEELDNIQTALDDLDLEARFLQLTQSITFDPLVREIDKLVNGVKTMSFDDIVSGIKDQQAIIADLTAAYDAMTAAEAAAQNVLAGAEAGRDVIGAQLDSEQAKLDGLVQAHEDILSLINQMESAMDAYVQASETADQIKKTKDGDGISKYEAAGAGDFPIAGGDSVLGAEGTAIDIQAFNDELQAEIDAMMKEAGAFDFNIPDLGDLGDIFAPWREKFDGFLEWVKKWGVLIGLGILAAITAFILGVPLLIIAGVALLVAGAAALVVAFWDEIVAAGEWLSQDLPEWANRSIVQPIWQALQGLWDIFSDVFSTIGGILLDFWNTFVWPVVNFVIGAFGMLVGALQTAWGLIVEAFTVAWDVAKVIWDWFVESILGRLIPVFEMIALVVLINFKLIQLAIEIAWAVIKKVWDAITDAAGKLAGDFMWLWGQVEEAFDGIEVIAKWLWHSVFEPIFGGIKTVVSDTWDGLRVLFDGFKQMLAPMKVALQWVYQTVIKPVLRAIASVFETVWNGIIGTIEGGVNAFITAFNLLGSAVNKVADLLGIGSRVSEMSAVNLSGFKLNLDFSAADAMASGGEMMFFEKGGVMGKAGGVTSQARAIVGEGSNIHPEYIIPTDPRYRNQAQGLYSELGRTMGLDEDGRSNMDVFGIGNAISSGVGMARDGLSKVGGLLKEGAIWALWNPLKSGIQSAINTIPNDFVKNIGSGLLNTVDGWVRGGGSVWDEEARNRKPDMPVDGAGSWEVIPKMLSQMGIPHKVLSTFRPGAVTRNTGQQSWHAKNRAIDLSGPSGMINYNHKDMLAINHAIYDAYKPQLKELIYGGPGAKNVFRGKDHNFSNKLMGEHINHVHAALAQGGFVVPRTPGGSLFRMGEGLYDEAVQVTPLHGGGSGSAGVGGSDTYNFYGDLSFPNITDPSDAESFLANLEALAGG